MRRTVERLRNSEPALIEPQRTGKLKIVGARYDLDDGRVDFFIEQLREKGTKLVRGTGNLKALLATARSGKQRWLETARLPLEGYQNDREDCGKALERLLAASES